MRVSTAAARGEVPGRVGQRRHPAGAPADRAPRGSGGTARTSRRHDDRSARAGGPYHAPMIPRRPLARALLAVFPVLVAAHLAVQLLGAESWARPSQVLLMPALALAVLSAAGRPPPRAGRPRRRGLADGGPFLGRRSPAVSPSRRVPPPTCCLPP